jgi:hypothetical protein
MSPKRFRLDGRTSTLRPGVATNTRLLMLLPPLYRMQEEISH